MRIEINDWNHPIDNSPQIQGTFMALRGITVVLTPGADAATMPVEKHRVANCQDGRRSHLEAGAIPSP